MEEFCKSICDCYPNDMMIQDHIKVIRDICTNTNKCDITFINLQVNNHHFHFQGESSLSRGFDRYFRTTQIGFDQDPNLDFRYVDQDQLSRTLAQFTQDTNISCMSRYVTQDTVLRKNTLNNIQSFDWRSYSMKQDNICQNSSSLSSNILGLFRHMIMNETQIFSLNFLLWISEAGGPSEQNIHHLAVIHYGFEGDKLPKWKSLLGLKDKVNISQLVYHGVFEDKDVITKQLNH